ncbi:MAG: T9SS type A sorting domain-containing protein [Candidatus Eisenbacteria bacterium]|uniref:T9SS type A sorting domain-containing protein n=1 Tax=Eiseniibacteriota bacterium TaxID=2212470 RepID=A0A956NEM9_UNCEI|nr:T9SS type A sorting domain-containing protein [Candidatus Eisenbacteria bacterium]MCB9465899.1 T9SS type A sorting domain-containing protein [Candidatus Eisenbacteria bacterium]
MRLTSYFGALLAFASLVLLTSPAAAELLLNDGWSDGQNAAFQGGFVAGEIGAVRLVPTEVPADLQTVDLLFGGSTGQRTVTLKIWDDSAGTTNPGALLYSGDYTLTGADNAINQIDVSGEALTITGPIRVGIEFQHSGYPSIARDDDGTIDINRNFIYTSGVWFRSNLFGLTGDWIIRATTTSGGGGGFTVGGTVTGFAGTLVLQNNGGDDLVITGNGPFTFPTSLSDGASYDVTVLSQPNGVNTVVLNGSGVINGADVTDVYVDSGAGTVLQNDGWSDGQNAAFQGGFVAGEIGAVRLVPGQPGDIEQIELLFGGSTAQQTVTLHIWDDSAEQINPGALLFSGDYLLTGADDAINVIDISAEQIQVPGPFRVGIEFQHTGYPSIARDDDGTINIDRNFIFTSNTWFRSNLFGVTGDWIIRARMAGQPAAVESVPIVSEHVYLAPTPLQSGALTVSFRSGGDGAMPHSVSIFDVTGRLVWSAAGSEFADVTGSTGDSWTWDGLDAHGREVASGVYLVRIETATQDYVKRFAVVR